MKLDGMEAKIFDCVKNANYEKRVTSRTIEANTGIDKRMIAASVRNMNENNKGVFYIGSDKKGYWLCRSEKEAIASLLSYNQTILSSLREYKKIKEQVRLTFGMGNDLFGEKVLSQQI